MKPAVLMVLAGGLILTGCTGMKSDFDCNATAGNSCMTMDEANNKARAMTESQKGKAAAHRRILPPLAAVPVVKENATAAGVTAVTKTTAATVTPGTMSRNPFRGHAAGTGRVVDASGGSRGSSAWSDIGMTRPVRLPSTTARMWIAAWTDEQAVWHQPSVVSFEVEPARWLHQGVKG